MEYQRKACSLLGYNFQIFNLWFGFKVFLSFHFESVQFCDGISGYYRKYSAFCILSMLIKKSYYNGYKISMF
jgi:hypothetical protein